MPVESKYLRPRDAGLYLGGIAPQTLARWRCEGSHFPFMKLGGAVLYAKEDLDKYLMSLSVRHSTSENHD